MVVSSSSSSIHHHHRRRRLGRGGDAWIPAHEPVWAACHPKPVELRKQRSDLREQATSLASFAPSVDTTPTAASSSSGRRMTPSYIQSPTSSLRAGTVPSLSARTPGDAPPFSPTCPPAHASASAGPDLRASLVEIAPVWIATAPSDLFLATEAAAYILLPAPSARTYAVALLTDPHRKQHQNRRRDQGSRPACCAPDAVGGHSISLPFLRFGNLGH